MENKVEFFKNRTLGERISASADFVGQNWKLLLKNIIYVALPLVLLIGFFYSRYSLDIQSIATNVASTSSFLGGYLMLMVFSLAFSLYITSITGAIMRKYSEEGVLPQTLGWADFKENCFSIMKKIFVQGLLLFILLFIFIFIFAFIVGMLASAASTGGVVVTVLLVLIILAAFFALIPAFCLVIYPIIFKGASPIDAIKQAFRLGFKYWGTTFLTCLLGGIIYSTVSSIFGIPAIVYTVLGGGSGLIGYIFSTLMYLPMIVTTPVFLIYLAYQYTSIVEAEEGISLAQKVDDFDKL